VLRGVPTRKKYSAPWRRWLDGRILRHSRYSLDATYRGCVHLKGAVPKYVLLPREKRIFSGLPDFLIMTMFFSKYCGGMHYVSMATHSCARLVSGVGLGPSYYPASLLWSPGPRPSPAFRSAICDCLSLNVSISPPA